MADGWNSGPQGFAESEKARAADARVFVPDAADALRVAAETHLKKLFPDQSCTSGVTEAQVGLARRIAAILGLGALIVPGATLTFLFWLAFATFLALICQRLLLIVAGRFFASPLGEPLDLGRGKRGQQIWPMYTVLVPVYREPEAVGKLVAALKGIDYPKRQLDIQILIEEEDQETLDALLNIRMRPHFRIVPVPKGDVQTKPRALNYGLSLARGQYVCIYDAEDQMHTTQIKAAVRAFQRDRGQRPTARLACVQAPLIPHNDDESWIAQQFTLEYAVHFGLVVPGLTSLGLPVMLGGTSNHFDKSVLEEIGGWDPYNVTEDADLGLRFARAGYRVGSIAPPTFEEAPVKRMQWIGQRSRWIKGFIQTLGVATRDPLAMARSMGVFRYLSAIGLLGGSVLSALLHGPLGLILLGYLLIPGLTPPGEALFLAVTGYSVHVFASLMVLRNWRAGAIGAILTAPIYWPLQTFAAIKAVKELLKDPYFWDKTDHGLTSVELCRSKLQAV